MSIPHQFPSLLSGPAQTILIAGTGLSAKVAPTVDDLRPQLDQVATKLGVLPAADLLNVTFYVLAEAVLIKLESEGRSADESRLYLAEDLGMLDDRSWFGETGVLRNTPRHRAIARFAVEKRLRAIISLNWDALLESALDSVGLIEGICPPRPWDITQYARVVEDVHLPRLGSNKVFPVIKPHGCVRELDHIRRDIQLGGNCPPLTLRVTETDLANPPGGQNLIDKKVEVYAAECPLLAIGWKASEKYLCDTLVNAVKAGQPPGSDRFTLISRTWHDDSHNAIAKAYNTTELLSFLRVENGEPTLDCVLQWLQALYAIGLLIGAAADHHKESVRELGEQLEISCSDHAVLKWVDTWLPAWVRLCWRAGVIHAADPQTAERIAPWKIPIIPRDVHVPLGTMAVRRNDLEAAAKLLITIRDDLDRFDFDRFPGGLWKNPEQALYLPLPGCRGAAHSSALDALKPMIETWDWPVKTIYLIWLDDDETPPEDSDLAGLEAQVRMLLPLTGVAASQPLPWVELNALKGA